MKRLLFLLLLLAGNAFAQPLLRNEFTTNGPVGGGNGAVVFIAGAPGISASTFTNYYLRSQGSGAPPIFDALPSSSGVNYWERTSTGGYDFLSPSNSTDSVSIGPNSVYAGNNLAVGVGGTIDVGSERNIATGLIGTITGDDNAAFNQPGTITGNMNSVFGSGHTVSGTNNAVFGLGNTVTGLRLFVIGQGQTVTDNDTFYSFLPSRFSTYLTINSKTNRISDSGTALTYNGIALSTNSGTVTGSGSQGNLARWVAGTALGSSIISDDGASAFVGGTGAFMIPSGTTAQRPVGLFDGMVRYNTTTARTEFYSSGSWRNHIRLEGDTMNAGGLTNRFDGFYGNGVGLTNIPAAAITPTAASTYLPLAGGTMTGSITNALLPGASLSGTTTNTSTFSGTFTNTGAMGVSGAVTLAGALTVSGVPTMTNAVVWGSTISFPNLNQNRIAWFSGTNFASGSISSTTVANSITDETGTGALVLGTLPSIAGANFSGTVTFTNGLGSLDTTATSAGAATGWTNALGRNAVYHFSGTAVTWTIYNNAGTAVWTNTVAMTGGTSVDIQKGGAITTAGTGVTGVGVPF